MRYLITGGTGTFGRAFTRHVLDKGASRVIAVSTGEHRQADLLRSVDDPRLECWTGNVRDLDRMREVMAVAPDVVIHAAAMKRIESCERDAEEAHKTNVLGTLNVVKAAMAAHVPRVVVISSDKACAPETVYGATKAEAEQLAIARNGVRGHSPTRISVVRYGNILGSQGSFLDVLRACRDGQRPVPITDPKATRFWWHIDDAVRFVESVITRMQGAEIWIPKLTSAPVTALAAQIAPGSPQVTVGMRGPEKLHEAMISATESTYAYELPDSFVLLPKTGQWWSPDPPVNARPVTPGFVYASDRAINQEALEALCASVS